MIILILLFILINCSHDGLKHLEESPQQTIKFLEFSFQRNLTINETMTPSLLFKNLFYNQIYITLKAGSTKKEIPFYIYLNQFPFIIQSANVEGDQVKGLYNESLSKTYEEKGYEIIVGGDMYRGILSKDNFNIQNDEIIPLNFYLSKENIIYSHINEGGKIGFKLYPPHLESNEVSFIQNLKINNVIHSNIFSIEYNSNENDKDCGKLIIGAYPHLYNQKQYKEENYIRYYANKGYSQIDWVLDFDEIKLGNEIVTNISKSYFYAEIGFIVGTKIFFEKFQNLEGYKKFFYNDTKCHTTNFLIDDFAMKEIQQLFKGEYIAYYCNKEVNVSEIFDSNNIFFINKYNNFSFILNNDDIWITKGDYKYIMIVQKRYYYNDLWILGKPFFQKYKLVFEYDNKVIGLYTKIIEDNSEENKNIENNYVYLLIIIGLIIIIVGLIFGLIILLRKLPRKKRANELKDQNYEYTENENSQNYHFLNN